MGDHPTDHNVRFVGSKLTVRPEDEQGKTTFLTVCSCGCNSRPSGEDAQRQVPFGRAASPSCVRHGSRGWEAGRDGDKLEATSGDTPSR